ncbi:flagellar associated protein [Haematococcus lacustris]
MSAAPNLDKVIALLTGRNSQELEARHLAAIDKLCASSKDGFAIRDLPKVQQILEITVQLLLKGNARFLQPAISLVRTANKPFVRLTATDEFRLLGNITSMLSSIGQLFQPQIPIDLQIAASEMLFVFATGYGNRPSMLDKLPAVQELDTASGLRQYLSNQMLLASSGVVGMLVRGLATATLSSDEVLMLSLAMTLAQVSYHKDSIVGLLDAGLLPCLPHLLSPDFRHPLVPVAVELLWNMLDGAPDAVRQALTKPQPSLSRVVRGELGPEPLPLLPQAPGLVLPALARALVILFRSSLLHGFRLADKELRNDVLLPSAQHPLPVHACAEVFALVAEEDGFYEAVLAVSTCPECGTAEVPGLVRHWAITQEDPDYELKQLAWQAATTGCLATATASPPDLTADPSGLVLEQAAAWGLLHLLLAFVELSPEATTNPRVAQCAAAVSRRWVADQADTLREAALSRLHALLPLMPHLFIAADGPATLLRLLAGSLHGGHVEAGLRLLHGLVAAVPAMAEVLGAAGLVEQLVTLLQDAAQPPGVRHFALLLLAPLCRSRVENLRRLRRAGGVGELLAQLERCKAADPTLPSPVTVAVVDAVWAGLVPDRKNAARFLVEGGLEAMCDLLECGNRGHRAILLSTLCDLLENTRSHPFFHSWRSSRNQQCAAHLLLGIWGEEAQARGMTQDGMLTNMRQPLEGRGGRTSWLPVEALAYTGLLAAAPGSTQAAAGAAHSTSTAQGVQSVTGSGGGGELVLPAVQTAAAGLLAAESSVAGRAAAVSVMLGSSWGEAILAKVHGCFRLLGFGSLSYLPATDAAALALVEKYVKFKQGEIWSAMAAEFEATGMRPTAPDRERLASGIELSEHLACALRETQAALLQKDAQVALDQETKFFEDIRAQRKLEQEARFYKKDRSQQTIAELREAKAKKEAMLRNSIRDFTVLDGLDD